MNPRIQQLATGITREVISEQTHLFYEPSTGHVSVSFQHRASLFEGDHFVAVAGDWATLPASIADIAARSFGKGLSDPVTNADLSEVSAAGLVLVIKAAFAALYDEAVAAEAAHQAEVEADAAKRAADQAAAAASAQQAADGASEAQGAD